eukprot:9352949-Pyramimonas_sp.AAC.1
MASFSSNRVAGAVSRRTTSGAFRKENCRKYATDASPGKAWNLMGQAGVPLDHRPDTKSMDDYRSSLKAAKAEAEEDLCR